MSSASMIILNNVKDAYYTGGMKKNDVARMIQNLLPDVPVYTIFPVWAACESETMDEWFWKKIEASKGFRDANIASKCYDERQEEEEEIDMVSEAESAESECSSDYDNNVSFEDYHSHASSDIQLRSDIRKDAPRTRGLSQKCIEEGCKRILYKDGLLERVSRGKKETWSPVKTSNQIIKTQDGKGFRFENDAGTWSTFVHNGRLMDGFRLSEWRVV